MDVLREMFGDVSLSVIDRALTTAGGSVETAIELMLAGRIAGSPHDESQASSSKQSTKVDAKPIGPIVIPGNTPSISSTLSEEHCILEVLAIIPDVASEHLKKLYKDNVLHQSNNIIAWIIEHLLDKGSDYPRQGTGRKSKQKRKLNEEPDQSRKPYELELDAKLAADLNAIEILDLDAKLAADLDAVQRQLELDAKLAASLDAIERQLELDAKLAADLDQQEHRDMSNLTTWSDNRKLIEKPDNGKLIEKPDNGIFMKWSDNGKLIECQCCFDEFTFSSMTKCAKGHLFCLECSRKNAEHELGNGRYKLFCMQGCKAEFSRSEVVRFLDDKILAALSRLEQEEQLRLAGIEGLTKCPFCDFAAICVPVEQDKEFRCNNPGCMIISCRLCQRKTHMSRSCEENAKKSKLSMRHAVEEAMTEALIRKCNKCNNKFIKELGCNKMHCTKCQSQQCYVCSKTITDYNHFDDASRGGKTGNCPLFDNTEARHEDEVKKAAQLIMEKLRQENPELSEEDLEIKLSEEVKKSQADKIARGSRRT